MSAASAEAQRLRIADRAREDAESRRDKETTQGAATVLARTRTITTYPTTAAAFYGTETLTVTGTETEGTAGTVASLADTFLALNLGTQVPPSGTQVICTYLDYRWVFRYDG